MDASHLQYIQYIKYIYTRTRVEHVSRKSANIFQTITISYKLDTVYFPYSHMECERMLW